MGDKDAKMANESSVHHISKKPGEPEEIKPQASSIKTPDTNVKRSGVERRELNTRFKNGDQRQSFDRRGRDIERP